MAIETPQRTLRDMIRRVSPPWLQRENGYRLLYSWGLMMDITLDAAVAAVRHRFPGYSLEEGGDPSYQSLGLIGAERRMRRGLFETDAAYALRLRRWWQVARGRGNPYELIEQLKAFHDPAPTDLQVIYRSGRRFSVNLAGETVMDDVTSWNPDGMPENWASYTVLLRTDVYHEAPTPAEQERALNDLRNLVVDMNAAHCTGKIIVMTTGTELWAALPPAPGDPDTSTWADSGSWASDPGTEAFVLTF